jgi:hypothetical protein
MALRGASGKGTKSRSMTLKKRASWGVGLCGVLTPCRRALLAPGEDAPSRSITTPTTHTHAITTCFRWILMLHRLQDRWRWPRHLPCCCCLLSSDADAAPPCSGGLPYQAAHPRPQKVLIESHCPLSIRDTCPPQPTAPPPTPRSAATEPTPFLRPPAAFARGSLAIHGYQHCSSRVQWPGTPLGAHVLARCEEQR